jgi:hypothetical protein
VPVAAFLSPLIGQFDGKWRMPNRRGMTCVHV